MPPAAIAPAPRRRLAALGACRSLIVVLLIFAPVARARTRHARRRGRPSHRRIAAHRHVALVAEAPDPLAARELPRPGRRGQPPPRGDPARGRGGAAGGNGAPSLRSVEQQLAPGAQARPLALRATRTASLVDAVTGAFTPRNVVPLKIAQVIAGGNAIADFPYVYGGGHGSFVDRAYDCSGSVSYALAAAGLIGAPETSGQLESWGAPGPGPLADGLRQRRPHVHERRRRLVRHGRPRRPLQHALADRASPRSSATPCATTRGCSGR